jgi:spore coat protein H
MGRIGLILSIVLVGSAWGAPATRPATGPTSREIFDSSVAHVVHIRLSSAAWDSLQPNVGATKVAANATTQQAKSAGVRIGSKGPLFAFVLGEMEFDGQKFGDVGLRFKGNSSYAVSAGTLRRPMKVDFDRFVEGGRFAGLETINLSNTTYDPSQVRESLAFWMYRKMGVPASRTGFALVYLSVAGKFEREYLGLYTLIEEVGHQFLQEHFGNEDGLLLKPSGMRGFAYLGEKWTDYAGICGARSEGKSGQHEKIVELGRLTHRCGDAEFGDHIGSVLAVDEFLRYVAVTSAVISFDSFLSTGHNYYMYVNPKDALVYFVPWDLNMSFGGYGWVGTVEELARTDIYRGYADHNILVERVLKIPKYRAAYRGHVQELCEQFFNSTKLGERREMLAVVLGAAEKATREAKRVGNPTTQPALGTWPVAPEIWSFLEMRGEWMRLQVEGNAVGFKPDFCDPKRTLVEWAPHTVAAVTFMDAVDLDGDRRLTDDEVKAGIGRLFAEANLPEQSVMDGVMLEGVLERLMPGELKKRVAAKAWAGWIVAIADANRDGHVSAGELLSAYQRWQKSNDADRDGMMDGRELVEQMGSAGAPRDADPMR